MAAAGPEEDEVPRTSVLTRASLMQRALVAWDAFVRTSILKAADDTKVEQSFDIFGSSLLTHVQNIAMKTRYAKVLLDIAKESELTVHQRVTIDDETTTHLIQKTDDIVFVAGRKVLLVVSWAEFP